jgi:hypothetical protein
MSQRIQLELFGVPSTITKRPPKPRNNHEHHQKRLRSNDQLLLADNDRGPDQSSRAS